MGWLLFWLAGYAFTVFVLYRLHKAKMLRVTDINSAFATTFVVMPILWPIVLLMLIGVFVYAAFVVVLDDDE